MTIKEKGELVTYINYLRARGEESRRTSRKDGIADYFRAYCSGSGQRALDIADELDRFLEGVEIECKSEILPTYESVGSMERCAAEESRKSMRPTTAKSTRGSSASGVVRSAKRFLKRIGMQWG